MLPDCPRCGGSLQLVDGDPPAFCPHCGLPQLRVSAEALSADATPSAGSMAPGAAGSRVDWALALRLVAAAAAVGVLLPSLLPNALSGGLVAGLSLLMTPVLTLVIAFTYGRSRLLTAGAGARMGALLGLLMGSTIAFLTGIAGFILRYHFHSQAMDDKIQQALSQMPAQISAAGPPPPGLLAFLQTPEFRAGTFIMGNMLSMLLLIAVGTLCGWLSAAILRVRRPADE